MLKKLGYVWLVQLVHPNFLIIAGEILDNPCLSVMAGRGWSWFAKCRGPRFAAALVAMGSQRKDSGPGRLRNVMAGMAQQ